MPRHAKSTKVRRDTALIKGIKKHFDDEWAMVIGDSRYTSATLAAVFASHLESLDDVSRAEAAWKAALQREEAEETKIKKLLLLLDPLLRASYLPQDLIDFGIRARTPRKPTTATLVQAVEKRRATRSARGTRPSRRRR
jgi:hypothetical protein